MAEGARARTIGLFTIAVSSLFGVLAVYSGHGPLPHNPIRLPQEKKIEMGFFLPQGWKFFTRDPQEEDTVVLQRSPSGSWGRPAHQPNASARNLFGANREGRAESIEMGRIATTLKKGVWQECSEAPAICLERAQVAMTVKNVSPRPLLCGTIGFSRQKPVPWAWRDYPSTVMPSRIVRVEVQC